MLDVDSAARIADRRSSSRSVRGSVPAQPTPIATAHGRPASAVVVLVAGLPDGAGGTVVDVLVPGRPAGGHRSGPAWTPAATGGRAAGGHYPPAIRPRRRWPTSGSTGRHRRPVCCRSGWGWPRCSAWRRLSRCWFDGRRQRRRPSPTCRPLARSGRCTRSIDGDGSFDRRPAGRPVRTTAAAADARPAGASDARAGTPCPIRCRTSAPVVEVRDDRRLSSVDLVFPFTCQPGGQPARRAVHPPQRRPA